MQWLESSKLQIQSTLWLGNEMIRLREVHIIIMGRALLLPIIVLNCCAFSSSTILPISLLLWSSFYYLFVDSGIVPTLPFFIITSFSSSSLIAIITYKYGHYRCPSIYKNALHSDIESVLLISTYTNSVTSQEWIV